MLTVQDRVPLNIKLSNIFLRLLEKWKRMKQIKTYKEPKWVALRRKILARDKYIDQYQKRYGRYQTANTVHHIFPVKYFPEYQFSEWNLISVSKTTHNKFHDPYTNDLTDVGRELLVRTALKNNIEVPGWVMMNRKKGSMYLQRY